MNFWTLIVIVCLAEGFLHYIPFKMYLRGHELPRVAAYTCGMLAILIPFTAWLQGQGAMISTEKVLTYLWASTGSAGAVVALLYQVDRRSHLEMKQKERDEEDAMRKGKNVS